VQEGKLLYEMGKLDESEKILVQVLKEDPSNKAARYYLDLIKEARFSARTYGVLPISNAMAATNQVYATGRQEILAKLNRIHLDEVSFDLPLSEAVNLLRAESKKRDPDGVGVN